MSEPDLFRVGRRQFLKGTALGGGVLLASSFGVTSLGAIAAQAEPRRGEAKQSGGTGPLVFAAEVDDTGTLASLVKVWNQRNPDTPVSMQTIPAVTNTVYQQYVTALAGGSSTPDVMSMDVTYIGTFAKAGWISPLTPYVDKKTEQQYTPTALALGTYDGKLYALQQNLDVGQFYYRTDLLKKHKVDVPTTYDELVSAAKKIQDLERKAGNSNFYGFVFEGAEIEAIFDQFDEYVWGFGGQITKGKKVTLDTSYGKKGLTFMRDCIYDYKISPSGESTMNPTSAMTVMQNGDAAFMRNWSFAYADLQNSQSKVAGRINNTTLPGEKGLGHGCTGGWMFGINKYTPRQLAAWRFIRYLVSQPVQAAIAIGMGVLPGNEHVLTEKAVIKRSPNLKNIPAILATAYNRPSIPDYPAVSSMVQAPLNSVMANQTSVAQALQTSQAAVANSVVA